MTTPENKVSDTASAYFLAKTFKAYDAYILKSFQYRID